MKKVFVTAICIVTVWACKKNDNAAHPFWGTWKLINVYDKVDGQQPLKIEEDTEGDALLTFFFPNTFDLTTPDRNFKGQFVLQQSSQINFAINHPTSSTSYTLQSIKAAWGIAPIVMLTACELQSMRPCAYNIFSILDDTLTITTPLRYILEFKKQ